MPASCSALGSSLTKVSATNSVCFSSISAFSVAKPEAPLLAADDVADVVQVHVKAPMQAAQHGVGVAELDHQRGDGGGGAAHGGLGGLGADAVAAHQLVVGFPVLAEARIVFRVDAFKVLAQLQAQAGLGDARLDHGGAADQDRAGQAVLDDHLHGAQHALVFAFGVGHALGLGGQRRGPR